MIGTRTPFRMSFIGGGSDLREFYGKNEGCVLSTTINKYMYIFMHPYFDNRIQVKYSKTELVDSVEKIEHPIVREALKKFKVLGVDINSIADIPAGTGLGSSSSYTVGLLHALYNFTGQNPSAEQLAQDACELEIDILKEPIGKQDQYAAAYGGLNIIRFLSTGEVKVEPINMSPNTYKKLQQNLLMFFTGVTRNASGVLEDQTKNMVNQSEKYDTIIQMTGLVDKAATCLKNSDLSGFGKTLHDNWELKKTLSAKISGTEIDKIYMRAMQNGAIGGKLLGAGGGGFLLFYCEPEYQQRVGDALRGLKRIDFKFEKSGSKILKLDR